MKKFKNFKLMEEKAPPHPGYFSGLAGEDLESCVIGKLVPWEPSDNRYVIYSDGDLMIANLAEEKA